MPPQGIEENLKIEAAAIVRDLNNLTIQLFNKIDEFNQAFSLGDSVKGFSTLYQHFFPVSVMDTKAV